MFKKLICYFFGHDWRYDTPTIPNKRICTCCKERQYCNYANFEWYKGFKDKFFRSDDELIKTFTKITLYGIN